MPRRFDRYLRIEPRTPFGNLDRGLSAEVYDPVWLLGRQWQLGEHQGEDASSPIRVELQLRETPLGGIEDRPGADLQATPPEALIEQEPDDWWTPGRRVAIGLRAAPLLPPLGGADPALLLDGLPAPYHRLNGRGYDGRAVYAARAALGLDADLFADVPALPQRDLWNAAELAYGARVTLTGGAPHLSLDRHKGGRLDWYAVDSDGPLPMAPAVELRSSESLATRLSFPGAPHPRWWTIEDAAVDIGAFAPDRSHFATLLLMEAVTSQGDNWFRLPLATRVGVVLTVERATVVDSFGDRWDLTSPAAWSLFRVQGLGPGSVVVWPSVTTRLEGSPIEDVVLGIDEDANLLVAVERRIDGRDVPTPEGTGLTIGGDTAAPAATLDASARTGYRYLASQGLQPGWHPYVVAEVGGRRRFVQARFADLATAAADLLPEARARLLNDPAAGPGAPVHAIEPAAVPEQGLRLHRRYVLVRATDGSPLLWIERRRYPLIAPPTLDLDFDVASNLSVATSRS